MRELLLQALEVDQRDAGQRPHGRVDVAGQREVEDRERPAAAGLDGARDEVERHDDAGRAGRGDDDVGLDERLLEVVEADAAALERGGEPLGVGGGAVGDDDLPAPARRSVAPASEPIEPAPTTSTVRPSSGPTAPTARSRPTVTRERPAWSMPVSLCARLPTLSAFWNSSCSVGPAPPSRAVAYARRSWPRICDSPMTIESSPQATSNRCRTAWPSQCT